MALPELEVEAAGFFAKFAFWIIAGIVIVVVLGGWLWWNSHENAKNAAAVPKAAAIQNKAQSNAGGAAVNTIAGNQGKNDATDKKTQTIINNYNSYPAAKVEVDPAFMDAFRHGVCMYRSAASLPECQRLLQPNP